MAAAKSPLQATGVSGKFINLSASGAIEVGQGTLAGVVVNSHSSGTIKLWNSLTASGTVMFNTITLAVGERWIPFFGANYTIGCFVTVGGTADLTFIYN